MIRRNALRLSLSIAIIVGAGLPAIANPVDVTGEEITPEEYAATFSIENLQAEGLIRNVVDLGNGTVSAEQIVWGVWVPVVLTIAPLDRPVAATPALEPDAPTVGEVLFNYPATAMRLAALVG